MQDLDRRWLKRFGRRDHAADVRLLCFHHAGGSAAMYRHWPGLMTKRVEPLAVQLPGRADRFSEPAYDRMTPLLDELIDAIKPLLDEPFACYGASMGARVAWALTLALRERAMPMPVLLYVASDPAPERDNGHWDWEGREDGLEGFVREMGGTPPEVLAEPELMAALLRVLHADLCVITSHEHRGHQPLDLPIRAFAGMADISASPQRMSGWRAETTARFDLDVLAGGHFFDSAAEREVIRTISRDLG